MAIIKSAPVVVIKGIHGPDSVEDPVEDFAARGPLLDLSVRGTGLAHRTFGVPNLFITDGSVLPTQGAANPALTIMALAARFADRMIAGQRDGLTHWQASPPKEGIVDDQTSRVHPV